MDDNETFQFNSTSDNNLDDANVESASAPPDAETSLIKSNLVNNLDNATVESASSDTFAGKSETTEVQVKTESLSAAESDSERIKRVLSNPDEYPENSYIYFYNESMGEGRGRRAICNNSLSESLVNEIRGKRGRDRSLSVVYSDLPDQWEADLHFHIAHTHYSGTERISSGHTSIVRAVIEDSCYTKYKMLSAMESSVNDKLDGLLTCVEHCLGKPGRELVSQLVDNFCQSVMMDVEEAEYQASKRMKYSFPQQTSTRLLENIPLVSIPSLSLCPFPSLKLNASIFIDWS